MARGNEKLKALFLDRLSQAPGLYGDGKGLYLRVSTATARSWVYRYMIEGRAREMGFGPYPAISLAQARALAGQARTLKALGQDPLAVREAEIAAQKAEAAKAVTFRYCADAYIKAREAEWKNAKHRAQWEATLNTYADPVIGDLSVQAVDVAALVKILEPIWKTKTETASRLRGRIESILDWAATRGFRTGENPARWKGHMENLFPKRARIQKTVHHAALPYSEIADFMVTLKQREGTAAKLLRFTILTAARTGEAVGARWDEIDFDQKTWTVPAERMKAGREHRVPLSKEAIEILTELRQSATQGAFVFVGERSKKPISNMAMLMLLRRLGREDLTVHGFRSTFRDWAAERTGYPGEVAEAALAHVVGDKVEAAYRRGDLFDKRRRVMADWGRTCSAPSAGPTIHVLRNTAAFRDDKAVA